LRQGRYGTGGSAVARGGGIASSSKTCTDTRALGGVALVGLALLVVQIALGGWTSANYAALACPDFPTCQTYWWPPTDFREAFTLWRGLGDNYEFGVLDNDARVTIHLVHRLGAVVVTLFLGWLSWRLIAKAGDRALRAAGVAIAVLLTVQLGLGIANVVLQLPLPVAVAHTGGAALLLLALVALNHLLRPESPP
jgi:cytochrome c oxidase assembly protein subunit 15